MYVRQVTASCLNSFLGFSLFYLNNILSQLQEEILEKSLNSFLGFSLFYDVEKELLDEIEIHKRLNSFLGFSLFY